VINLIRYGPIIAPDVSGVIGFARPSTPAEELVAPLRGRTGRRGKLVGVGARTYGGRDSLQAVEIEDASRARFGSLPTLSGP
jgi:hypothetical protein